MVTKEMICAAHDICLKKGDFVLSASLLERIYLAMRDKADGRDSAGWDAYEDLRKASDEMVLNLRQRVRELEKQRDELLADLAEVKRSAEFNFEQYQDVGRLLHEECEKTEKLLAALERFATWARGQHRAQSKGCYATFDMMMLRDEIDFAEAAIELHGEYARLNPVGVKGEQ